MYDEATRNAIRKAQGGVSDVGGTNTPVTEETPTEGTQAVRKGRKKKVDPIDEAIEADLKATLEQETGSLGADDTDDTDDTAADNDGAEVANETPVEEPKTRTRKSRRITSDENN